MNHLLAIEILSDALDEAQKQCDHLSRGIASMRAKRLIYPESIRKDALTRWRRALGAKQKECESLRNSIEVLEGLDVTEIFGARFTNSDDILVLEGLSFTQARDLCEVGGAQLMKQTSKGEWEEA